MKLIDVLTQDEKSLTAEQATFEAQQQDVNLQAFVIGTSRNLSELKGKQNGILRAGGPTMWAKYDQLAGQIAELEETLVRLAGYRVEFFG